MGILTGLLLASAVASASAAGGVAPTTLDGALARAHQANAELPIATLDRRIAAQRLREAQAQRRVVVSADGELWIAPAGGYDPTVTDQGDERLQMVAEKRLYDGGALRARERSAEADVRVAGAQVRMTVADLDRRVREAFAGVLAGEREAAVREEGIERLRHYVDLLEARSRGGQPVTADLLNARVRLATELAARSDAEGRAADRRAELAVLMGLPPEAALELAPLPAPSAPAAGTALEASATTPPVALPDLAAVRQEAVSAAADVDAARAERAPQVSLRADAGLWGADPLHPGAGLFDRLQRDFGASLTLGVHLPLFDTGGVAARIAQAELALQRARRSVTQAEVQAGLERAQARRALAGAYEQYRLLTDALPATRDAYLNAQSRYWGGSAGYLEVLDALSATVDTAVNRTQAELAYHEAEARLLRWGGTP
jgi:outer membrane protein TolC